MRKLSILFICCFSAVIFAQDTHVLVDKDGVMKWNRTQEEVQGFGVNYTVPFAHAYRSAKKMNIDIKKAIDQDIYHFSRLGFDLFRVHVWDTEISDTLGNLLVNEHLDHYNYLLKKLKDRNIKIVLTPIAFWGNGWPEPDKPTPGFSYKYGKEDCLTNPDAIAAQQNYLFQFMNHVNPYTGIAYKDDPDIIAVEISNEPHHRGKSTEVTKFVKGMVKAVKRSGTKKPVFYNISHGIQFSEAYFKGGIDGGTFQWYPTGLGYQQEIQGNHLSNVAAYNIPFETVIKDFKGAKLVYEFDAADIGEGYIYPAMARSFRTAGIQIATHFSYDPTYLAPFNTEYNTHYMNLNYTPQKALGLMISAEVFRMVPMYSDYGKYPVHNNFDDFLIDPKKQLALFNSTDKFYYTSSTVIEPKDTNALWHIAGHGNSPIVKYNGTGAYFLDKLNRGVWRLEIQPDAAVIKNPYGRNSLKKQVGAILWNTNTMEVYISDLGSEFKVTPINKDNNFTPIVNGTKFKIRPGTYILEKKDSKTDFNAFKTHNDYPLNSFFAPKSNLSSDVLIHKPINEITENEAFTIELNYYSNIAPLKIDVMLLKGRNSKTITLEKTNGFTYSAALPIEMVTTGFLNYYIVVHKHNGKAVTYPANKMGKPFDWDFYDRNPYQVKVIPSKAPVMLFNAEKEHSVVIKPWRSSIQLKPMDYTNESAYFIDLKDLSVKNPENRNRISYYDYTLKHFVGNHIKNHKNILAKKAIVLKGFALNEKNCTVQIALVMENGMAYGGLVEIEEQLGEYVLPLKNLKPVKTVTLPRPYPTFLPYYLDHNMNEPFELDKVEYLQLSFGPGLSKEELTDKHGIAVLQIKLN